MSFTTVIVASSFVGPISTRSWPISTIWENPNSRGAGRRTRSSSGSSNADADEDDALRRAPAHVEHRPDRQRARREREHRPQAVEDPWRVADGVGGEQNVVERLRLHPGDELRDVDAVLDADHSADADEREAERRLGIGELR